jgi:Carboxypeptidase activation peptide
MLKILFILIIFKCCSAEKAYDRYKVYNIKLKNNEELQFIQNLEENEGEKRELDFLSLHNNVDDMVQVMVKPEEQNYIEGVFEKNTLNYEIAVENVQE